MWLKCYVFCHRLINFGFARSTNNIVVECHALHDQYFARQRLATLQAEEPHGHRDIVQAVGDDLELNLWKRAAKHFLGDGLQQGRPNFEPARLVRRKLLRAAQKEKADAAVDAKQGRCTAEPLIPAALRAAALQAANAGGATVGARYVPPRPCPRCGAPAETARHRYFECADNDSPEILAFEPALQKTAWVGQLWSKPSGQTIEQCLWGRGILPADHSQNLATETGSRAVVCGNFARAASAAGTLYADGSGGPKHAASALRRAGAGAAVVHTTTGPSGEFLLADIGLLLSQVPGRQSVPRAETFAGAQALAHAEPGTLHTWWSDAA